jgi:protein involved in sex pheromone biosynthesis
MKSLPIASLALVLVLSGCASSQSIEKKPTEEEIKLVEYEQCLQWIVGNNSIGSSNFGKVTFDDFLRFCEKYRP